MAGEKILIVDDEAVIRKLVHHHLEKNGFQVISANDGHGILELIDLENPDLIILDILLPGMDGIEICRELRKENNVPVIFISSKNDSSDIVLGLGVGGDDYIIKPFNPNELIARVKANLRRATVPAKNYNTFKQKKLLRYSGLEINLSSRSVHVNGLPVNLTNKEYELLALLASNPDQVFTYDKLMELIWHYKGNTDNRTVMVHINRLRKKIERKPSQPQYILTVRGAGYKFYSP